MSRAVSLCSVKLIRGGNSDVGHVGVGSGAVPVIFSLQDMDHVSNGNFLLVALIRNYTDPSSYY